MRTSYTIVDIPISSDSWHIKHYKDHPKDLAHIVLYNKYDTPILQYIGPGGIGIVGFHDMTHSQNCALLIPKKIMATFKLYVLNKLIKGK